jgi:hypothetical protein
VAARAAHLPLVRIDDAEQHAQGGGLARAIGAEHAIDRTGRDAERDAFDRTIGAEALDQPFGENDGLIQGAVSGLGRCVAKPRCTRDMGALGDRQSA